MIIEIPNENSIVKWKNDDKDEWKIAEISDLIKAYERPQGDIKKYKPLEADYNVQCAVENLKTAYWSNEPEKVAKNFTEAEDIIISAICHHGYSVCKQPQDNITEEDIQNAIKAGYENGYSMAKAKYQKPQGEREFIEILAEYREDDYDTLPEYRGKPYYSIHYRENDEEFVGYGTYNIEVLSDYLREYFFIDNAPTVEEIEKPFITECRNAAIKNGLPLYFVYYEETGIFEVYITETKELFEKRHCAKHLSNYEFKGIVNHYLDDYSDWKGREDMRGEEK